MGPRRYRNFVVRLGALDESGRCKVTVPGWTPGLFISDEEYVAFPPDYFKVSGVKLDDKLRSRPVKAEHLYQIGALLSDLALPGKIRSGFLENLATVRRNGHRLRLRLILEDPRFLPLPWEYLYVESIPGKRNPNDFLALNQDISIARLGPGNTSERAFTSGGKYRLAAALSSPKNQDPLNVEADRAAIQAAIAAARGTGEMTASWADPATVDLLQETLRDGCDIFHFSGHGLYLDGAGQILLEDAKGNAVQYDAGKLSQLLVNANAKVAILSACDTGQLSAENPFGGVATSLAASGLPAVVASQYRLQDRNALPLTREIYRSLLSGEEIDDGVYQARRAIYQQSGLENRDWGALVLYLRSDDGIVFRREEAATVSRPRIGPTPLQMPLIGREPVILQVKQDLEAGSKVYFHGGVGIGKTSLATTIFTAIADDEHFPDGYIWGSAEGMNAERLLEWVASNFPEQVVSQAVTKTEKANELRKLLATTPKLLIGIDDLTTVDAARTLLDAAGQCTVILNGQKAFDLSGRAKAHVVGPLTPELSWQLFATLAGLQESGLQPADKDLIRRICERMRWLPLGIKLAAAKCAEGESLRTVWDRMESAPGALATDAIRALFEATFDELAAAPEAQRILVRLASFPALEAPFDPLRDGEDDTEFYLAKDKLYDLSLVESGGLDRLALHPVIGPLALQRADPAMVKLERQRMLDWLIAFARDNRDSFDALQQEHRNLTALMDSYGRKKKWQELAAVMECLFDYLRVRGLWSEALLRLDQCLNHEASLNDASRAACFRQRGIVYTLTGSYDKARSDLARSKQIYLGLQDQAGAGTVEYRQAILTIARGELVPGAEELRTAIADMGDAAPAKDRAGAHSRLGLLLSLTAPSLDQALAEFQNARRIAEVSGDLEEQARAHLAIGGLHERRGEAPEAQREYALALDLAVRRGDPLQQAQIQLNIGYLQFHKSRFDEARASFEGALELLRALGYQPGIARALHALGNSNLAKQANADAETNYNDALKINDGLKHVREAAYNRYQLGTLKQRAGDLDEAERLYQAALDVARNSQDQVLEGGTLFQLAKLALERKDAEKAMQLAKSSLAVAGKTSDMLTQAFAHLILARAGTDTDGIRGELQDAYQAFAPFMGQEAEALLKLIGKPDQDAMLPDHPLDAGGPATLKTSFGRDLFNDSIAAESERSLDPGPESNGAVWDG